MTRATPKSRELGRMRAAASVAPGSGRSTGLTSRWTTPWAWAWASASHRAIAITMRRGPTAVRFRAARAASRRGRARRPGRRPSSSTAASYRATIPGWREAGGGTRLALEAPAESRSRGMTLTATSRSRRSSCASQTVPNPPVPSRRTRRYRASTSGVSAVSDPGPSLVPIGAVGNWLALIPGFSTSPRPSLRSRVPRLRPLPCMSACLLLIQPVRRPYCDFPSPARSAESLSFFDEADEPSVTPRTAPRRRRPSGAAGSGRGPTATSSRS